ncbi:fungal-specific transcription factor domain-containing protein [Podospora australis]|uniref:Fungal-specific transcription factor domain-containing protein n=1 Tax=Podospora australis TaxID=1536484 RepID=A0AAN6WXI4_9PEZI|nr:fungal-specific transcription factor domain-containing protein [Podospora australis]
MKNRQKSRSGCRTCDETKPGCRNCAQKGFECPGYQQRLQWSTKHERLPTTTKAGPENFTQLVTAASASISQSVSAAASPASASAAAAPTRSDTSTGNGAKLLNLPAASPTAPPPHASHGETSAPRSATVSATVSAAASPSRSSFTLSPPPKFDEDGVENVNVQPSHGIIGGGAMVHVAGKTPPLHHQQPQLAMYQQVVDIPTFLIEHWFKSVCCSWSAFDSQANPYRRLTSALWNKSTPVFYALQAISAASLVERLPHVMRDTARAAPRKAAEAIHKELVAFSNASRPRFPSELLLSLFCMSSSMAWLESRQLGQHYVRQARAVLKSLDTWRLDDEAKELVDFFNGCLIYEEMLRSVVSEDEIDFEHMLSWPEPVNKGPLVPTTPHAWTGVSADVFRLFGKAIALCRRSRTRWRHNDGTSYRILQGAMKDIQEATSVEESLLAIDIADPSELLATTQPQHTAAQAYDLFHATQAYRLSSLLQLYETFPDLVSKRMPGLADADGSVIWNTWVSPLALHVAEVLEKLPVGSMRCIQPLLCLCAGSGLRYDAKVPLGRGSNSHLLSPEIVGTTSPSSAGSVTNVDFLVLNPEVSESSIKISRARAFVMERLDQLESSLPPKPIGVAKQLLRAVWTAYDEEIGLTRRTHWLDVMSYTGLHSLFG